MLQFLADLVAGPQARILRRFDRKPKRLTSRRLADVGRLLERNDALPFRNVNAPSGNPRAYRSPSAPSRLAPSTTTLSAAARKSCGWKSAMSNVFNRRNIRLPLRMSARAGQV